MTKRKKKEKVKPKLLVEQKFHPIEWMKRILGKF